MNRDDVLKRINELQPPDDELCTESYGEVYTTGLCVRDIQQLAADYDNQVEQIWLNGYYACLAHAEAEHAERAKVLVDASKSLMDEAIKMAATARSGVTINGYKLSESEWDEWIVKCHEAGIALNKAIEVKNE